MIAVPRKTAPHRRILSSYEFATQRLSAGEKIMLRIGEDNAKRIRIKLREIRSELASVIISDRAR